MAAMQHFEVQIWPRCPARITHQRNDLALSDLLAGLRALRSASSTVLFVDAEAPGPTHDGSTCAALCEQDEDGNDHDDGNPVFHYGLLSE